jgi:hypothetical protein
VARGRSRGASFFETVVAGFYRVINRWRVWYRLPFPLAVILFDTETAPPSTPIPADFDIRRCRTVDGTFNDLSKTWMGMANTRFGRNAPLAQTYGEQPPSPSYSAGLEFELTGVAQSVELA